MNNLSEIYSEARKKEDKETFWVYYVTRPVSFWITPIFLKLGFSANQVSIFGMFVGIISAGFLIFGNYWLVLAGAILLELWLVLDSVDGNVARIRKIPTLFGKFLEEIDGAMMSALFFLSIGFAAAKFPGFVPVNIPSAWFIILGTITSLFVIFRHLAMQHFHNIFFSGQSYEPEPMFEKSAVSLLYRFLIKFLGVIAWPSPF